MKKLLLFALIAVIFSACDKNEKQVLPSEVDVSFNISDMMDGGLKADWECPTDEEGNLLDPDYALVTINDGVTDTDYYLEVFRLPMGTGPLYTQTLKLDVMPNGDPKTYEVKSFLLYNYGPDGMMDPPAATTPDDILVMATPMAGADFSEYVNNPVANPDLPDSDPFIFTVYPFDKIEVEIEVLCFLPNLYKEFGFGWFAVTEIILREVCFFGDICVKFLDDYVGSLYENQRDGVLQHDMPALFTVKLFSTPPVPNDVPRTDNPDIIATNAEGPNWGVGAPLCVMYPDNLSIDDNDEVFYFEIWIYVADGNDPSGFSMKYFGTFSWSVADMLADEAMGGQGVLGGDGVFEFVLGNCAYPGTDVVFPPYMNLPATCTLTTIPGTPGQVLIQDGKPGYFDVLLSNITPDYGYELSNGTYGINCFNRGVYITIPETYEMNIFSSLYPELMIGDAQLYEWDQVNWLINHLGDYPGYSWADLQYALWIIETPGWAGVPGATTELPAYPKTALAIQMGQDAIANGDGFVPLPGGWAAVAFENQGAPAAGTAGDKVQCIFTRIDP